MKALVLAGGLGTRLRPLTHTTAKQVIPVANKPVLHYGLEAISAAGIVETVIVVGDRARDIQHVVGDGRSHGLEVTYLNQAAPFGLAHCVQIARDHLGDDDFVLYLGDTVIVGGIGGLIDDFRAHRPAATIMVAPTADASRYGVAEVDVDGRVTTLQEKPAAPRSNLAVIGAYAFSSAIHHAVLQVQPSWRYEHEITDAIAWLLDAGHDVRAHRFGGYWKDTGRAEDLLDCNRTILAALEPAVHGKVYDDCELVGAVFVDEGVRMSGSRVVGPAIIGPDSTITDSYIGPYTAIGAGCDIVGAGVERSILLEGASIQGVHAIRDSIVGRQARIRPSRPVTDGFRLILGDHSQVALGA